MIKLLITEYHSMSTISSFISFVLLVNMKLYNSLSVAYQSVKNDKMMSAFMNEFVSYNVLDPDYIKTLTDNNNENRNALYFNAVNFILVLSGIILIMSFLKYLI